MSRDRERNMVRLGMTLVALGALVLGVPTRAQAADGGTPVTDAGAGSVDAGADAGRTGPGPIAQLIPPKLMHFVAATYPGTAQAAGVQGDVSLDLDIAADGHVSAARLLDDPGFGLGASALAAAKQLVFTPARIGGQVRSVTLKYTYKFRLSAPVLDGGSLTVVPPAPAPPQAPAPGALVMFESKVEAEAPTSAASSTTVRDRDLVLRPHATPEDILRVVPGLVIAQHQGGGKADQLFLRGFDADHGTDVAVFMDGAPVNMPSHGHGQGFADIHFLIPEVIDRVDVTKGPYYPEYGDFDTAGAVNLRTRRSFDQSSLSALYGSFDNYRVLGIAAPKNLGGSPWLAAAVEGTNGPFDTPENLQRYNVFGKDTVSLGVNTELSLLVAAYGSQWSASGQIPTRAVDEGLIDRFGAIDPSEGGQTQRQELLATLTHHRAGDETFEAKAWVVNYNVRLFSDFTFALRDPLNLDEIEQDDHRTSTGLDLHDSRTAHLGALRLTTTLGAQARYDDILTELWHDKDRVRLADCFDQGADPCDDAHIAETNVGIYLMEDLRVGRWLRAVVGVRGDLFEMAVDDLKPIDQQTTGMTTSGLVQKSIVNPKFQLALRPTTWWDIYLDGGGGFHSNDARVAVAAGGKGALPRAWGGEIGSRVRLFRRLDVAAALWDLYLQSEQVFDADEDTTEPAGPTNRYGLDLEARLEILPWLWADADLELAHARYTREPNGEDIVALAPTRTAAAGITALHPSGWKGRLGMRYVGDRAATEDGSLTAKGYTLFDLSLGYRWRFVEVGVVIENLLDTRWEEAQFATLTRLPGEGTPVTDIAFTPGNPRNGRVTLTLYY